MDKYDIRKFIKEIEKMYKKDPNNKSLSWLWTVFSKLPEHQLDALNYFDVIMNDVEDLTLIVLRGHLLIEQQIQKIFNSIFSSKINKSIKIDSHTMITLIESLYRNSEEVDNRIWISVKKLNKIRNDLAHNIENPGLNDKIEDLIKFEDERSEIEIDIKGDLASKLKTTIYGMAAVMISVASHAVEDHDRLDKMSKFAMQFNKSYTDMINFTDKIRYEKQGVSYKDNLDRNKFTNCFNEDYDKIYKIFINMLDEYVDSTYGALLAAEERVETMPKEEIAVSLTELQSQHSSALDEMLEFFIKKYSELIKSVFDKLKNTLDNEFKTLIA
jgi:hypothetical protein